MDEEVYFCRKNTNKRKFAGTAKRKGSTLRKSKASDWFQKQGGRQKQNFVTKFVSDNDEWNRKSLQQFSENVIEDGGIREFNQSKPVTYWHQKESALNGKYYSHTSVTYSLNKKKRWLLPKKIENVMMEQARDNDDLEPDLTVVERKVGPNHPSLSRTKMNIPDVTSTSKSRVVKRAGIGKKSRVNKENCREFVKKSAKKPYSFTTDLLGMTQGKQAEVAPNSQPEILYEFTTSRKPDDFPVYQPTVANKQLTTVMKLRGTGRQKTRRYLECDHHSIQNDIQAFRDRENFKAMINAKKEKAMMKKAKSESMIFSQIIQGNDSSSEVQMTTSAEDGPVEAVVAWEHLDNDLSIIEVKPVSAEDQKRSGSNVPENSSIDVLISQNSLSNQSSPTMIRNVATSGCSPKQTSFDVSQALKQDFGITIPNFFAIVKQKENSDLEVGRVMTEQPTKLLLTSSDENLQRITTKFLKEKYSAENDAGFLSVHEFNDIIEDLLRFLQKKYLRDSQVTEFKNTMTLPLKTDLLQPLLAEFGLHHESLCKSDITNVMEQPLSQSITKADDDFMWDDDDFVLIVPPATVCDLCSVDFNTSPEEHLALSPCYHRCCHPCWVRYIRSALATSKSGVVACPAQGCATKVDDITLMSLLPDNEYWQFEQKRVEAFVAKNKRLAWCPNKLCGKVVKVCNNSGQLQSSGKRANVLTTMICDCGAAWCTACGKEAHWPATCAAYDKYASQIEKHVEQEESNAGENVMPCPQCKLPIAVGNAGANVKCLCGHTFCWTSPDDYSNDHDQANTITATVLLDSSSDFQKAVNYRAKVSSTFYREIMERRLSFLAKRLCLKADKDAFVLFSKLTDWFTAVEQNGSSLHYENNMRRFTRCAVALKEFQHVLQYLHVVLYCKRPYNRKQRTEIKLVMNNLESTASDLEWSLLFKECDRGEVKLLEACEQHAATGKRLLQTVAKIIA